MNRKSLHLYLATSILLLFSVYPSFGQGTAFLYQGQLNNGGSPANGAYNFKFILFNAVTNGVQYSSPITNNNVAVNNGLFTTTLDFGSNIFTGPSLWLQIGVCTNSQTSFTTLSPLQPILPVPYSIFATSASNLVGALPASQLSGTLPSSAFAGYTNTVALTNGANLFSGSFSGNGAGVTNVNVSHLTGVLTTSQLPNNTAYVNANQTFTGNNTFTGINVVSNMANIFAGSFFGNGLVGWSAVSGTSQQALSDHGYLLTSSSIATVTLPASPNVGDIIRIAGAGSGGWEVAQNSGQSIIGNFFRFNAIWYQSSASSGNWLGMASSSDGTRMAAVTSGSGGNVYVSINSGQTWSSTSANSSGASFVAIASSADGTHLAATGTNNAIYFSTNSGSSWTAIINPGNKNWSSIASSSDGTRLVACVNNTGSGYLYTFLNGTLVNTYSTPAAWTAVASSASGTNLVAVAYGGNIYTSANAGAGWNPVSGLSSQNWKAVASSADGTKLAAAIFGGGIYTSANSGASWALGGAPSKNWTSIACTSDGGKLVAVANDGSLYTSTDWGATWTQHFDNIPSGANWSCSASSANGNVMATGVFGGGIYTAQPSSQTVTTSTQGTSGGISGGQASSHRVAIYRQ